MTKFLLMSMLALTFFSCDRQTRPNAVATGDYDSDNTGRNVRDRDYDTKTSFDQSESTADRTITQRIRQALIADDSLSTNAKNIKIITINGVVTLRGPVASFQEKDAIAQKINNIDGIAKLDNQLEITRNNK